MPLRNAGTTGYHSGVALPPPIDQHRDAIHALCRRYSVRKLELFGSAVTGTFNPRTSDFDFLVEFLPLPEGQRADAYFGLREDLEALLERPIDLVMTQAIRNRYFLARIRGSRTPLYAA